MPVVSGACSHVFDDQGLFSAPFSCFPRRCCWRQVDVKGIDSYTKRQDGLYLMDQVQGGGPMPSSDSEVVFHYTAYNENGGRIDSSYRQGQPVRGRMGINAMIPGFELGISTMRVGGRRRIIVPPELGPPVGPSTFFSARQFEVFDVELLAVRSCTRRTILFYSDEQCTDVLE